MNRSLLSILLACGGVATLAGLSLVGCNNNPSTSSPDAGSADMSCAAFAPAAECEPTQIPVKPFSGSRQLVLSSLAIANFGEGFDLNCDGKVDNILNPLGGVANSGIADTFQTAHSVILPIELFGYSGMDTSCAKLAFYLGRVTEDRDNDGAPTSWQAGKADCDDTNAAINPGAKEDLTNRVDDDCDGYADNATKNSPPTDKTDQDGDGQSMADGDCDDRASTPEIKALAATKHKGAKDICGNGIDEDCDGIADNDPSCDPFKDNDVPVHVTEQSFKNPGMALDGGSISMAGLEPYIVFPDGNVKGGVLTAGPDLFTLDLNIDGNDLNLTLGGAHIKLNLEEKNGGTYVTSGILGGVLEAQTLSQIHLSAGSILKKDQSLLDAVFVGPVATILGLNSDNDGHYLPDIDVDGDGLETFWQENTTPSTDGGTKDPIVDTCKDGDGTIVHNNFDGNGTICALAKDAKGKYRFVDGLSAALKFTAVPAKLTDVVVK